MELHDIGHYFVEHSDSRVVAFVTKCLGFTAVAIEALLDEINDEEAAAERWGMEEAV